MPDSHDQSPLLSLPYLQPAQAQKHVTHNEALRILDVLVQAAVESRTEPTPPASPAEGARYLVPGGAGGEWAGHGGEIAFFDGEAWEFLAPRAGWQVQVIDEGVACRFDGALWRGEEERALQAAELGIATSADATNRLAVASPATLLTHAGAGHQLKINKSGAGETASLLFQSGWSGRAEMGLAGEDAFSIKTSADGSAWQVALRLAGASGLASGSAVVSGPTDATPGRLLTGGFAGLGSAAAPALTNLDTHTLSGFWRWGAGAGGVLPAASGMLLHLAGGTSGEAAQLALGGGLFWRLKAGGAWGSWTAA